MVYVGRCVSSDTQPLVDVYRSFYESLELIDYLIVLSSATDDHYHGHPDSASHSIINLPPISYSNQENFKVVSAGPGTRVLQSSMTRPKQRVS